jgi:hypothetical protein
MADCEAKKHKKRDAAYYRAYRLRKKEQEANMLLFQRKAFNASSQGQEEPLQLVLAGVFVFILTGVLIHLAVPFYRQSHGQIMSYVMASLSELGILVLVSLKFQNRGQNILRAVLVVLLSAYSLVPIALMPIQSIKETVAEQQQQAKNNEQLVTSIRDEVASRKLKVVMLRERGRINLAQNELDRVANLENELRNHVVQTKITAATGEFGLQGALGMAAQRIILLLCNIFLVHYLSANPSRFSFFSGRRGVERTAIA